MNKKASVDLKTLLSMHFALCMPCILNPLHRRKKNGWKITISNTCTE